MGQARVRAIMWRSRYVFARFSKNMQLLYTSLYIDSQICATSDKCNTLQRLYKDITKTLQRYHKDEFTKTLQILYKDIINTLQIFHFQFILLGYSQNHSKLKDLLPPPFPEKSQSRKSKSFIYNLFY